MNIRPKKRGPLGKTLGMVAEAAPAYSSFGTALWHPSGAASVQLKELIFIRTSIVNQCPT